MKTVSKIIETIEFGKCRQDITITFKYDSESVEDIVIQHDNYENGKHIVTHIATGLYTDAMQQAMIESAILDDVVEELEDKIFRH